MTEHCRNWIDNDRCGKPADVIVWGKLMPPDALGPRCWFCVEGQLGYRQAHDPQWAIYRIPQSVVGVTATNPKDA